MSSYFFDSSAIVKRYLTEIGSGWVMATVNPAAEHHIVVAEITLVEVAAALAARHRAPHGLSLAARDTALAFVRGHFATEYENTAIDRAIRDDAVALTQRHRLRGYDAIQPATALATATALQAASLTPPIFVAADTDLIAATQAEGLFTNNPNDYR